MGGLNFEWLQSCTNSVLQKVFVEDTDELSPWGGFPFI